MKNFVETIVPFMGKEINRALAAKKHSFFHSFTLSFMLALVFGMASCGDGNVIDEEQIDPKLAAPTGLQAEARESGMYEETFIDLKWNAVKNAAQYNVYYLNKEGQYDLYKTVSDCKCTVEFVDIFKYVEIRAGETEDESYYVVTFQVKAVNAEGKVGKPSEPKTVEIENDFV